MALDVALSEDYHAVHVLPILRALAPSERGVCYLRDQRTHPLEPEIGELMEVRHGVRDRRQTDSPLLCASWGDAQPEKRRLVVMLDHGTGQRYGDGPLSIGYVGGLGRERVCLFLDPNEHARSLHAERYPDTPGVVVGQPILDQFADGTFPPTDGLWVDDPHPKCLVLAGHWGNQTMGATRSAWPHHWDQAQEFRHALAELRDDGWTIFGHGHPRGRYRAPGYEQAWERFGVEPMWDFDGILRRATVLCADNTSAQFLSAAVGVKQVVLDAPWYTLAKDRGYWPRWSVPLGREIMSPSELADAVRTATIPDVREVVPFVGGSAKIAAEAIRKHVLRRACYGTYVLRKGTLS